MVRLGVLITSRTIYLLPIFNLQSSISNLQSPISNLKSSSIFLKLHILSFVVSDDFTAAFRGACVGQDFPVGHRGGGTGSLTMRRTLFTMKLFLHLPHGKVDAQSEVGENGYSDNKDEENEFK